MDKTSYNSKILFTAHNIETYSDLLPDVQDYILANVPGHFASFDFIRSLPKFDLIFKEALLYPKFLEEIVPHEEAPYKVVGFCYVTSGFSQKLRIKTKKLAKEVDLILINLRFIYECFSFCLASPLAQKNADWKDGMSIIALSLATRLNSKLDENLVLISLGLTSYAMSHLTNRDGEYPFVEITTLIKASLLSEKQEDEILLLICRLIFFHELAHFLFQLNSDYKTEVKNAVLSLGKSVKEDYKNIHTRIEESLDSLFANSNLHLADEQLTLDEVDRVFSGKSAIFSSYDLEELMCDYVSIGFLFSTTDFEKNPDLSLSLFRETILLVIFMGDACGIRSFDFLGELINIFEKSIEPNPATDYIEQFLKSTHRYDLLASLRNLFAQHVLKQNLTTQIDKNDDFPEDFYKNWTDLYNFKISIKYDFSKRLLHPIGLMKLSSWGRGTAMFLYPNGLSTIVPNQYADPFSLYTFSRSPSQDEETDNLKAKPDSEMVFSAKKLTLMQIGNISFFGVKDQNIIEQLANKLISLSSSPKPVVFSHYGEDAPHDELPGSLHNIDHREFSNIDFTKDEIENFDKVFVILYAEGFDANGKDIHFAVSIRCDRLNYFLEKSKSERIWDVADFGTIILSGYEKISQEDKEKFKSDYLFGENITNARIMPPLNEVAQPSQKTEADYRKDIEFNPSDVDAYEGLVRLLRFELKDRLEESLPLLEKIIEINADGFDAYVASISINKELGKEIPRIYIEKARQYIPENDFYSLACLESICDNFDLAFEYLSKATQTEDFDSYWAWEDPDLQWLRNNKRFTEIVGENPNNN